MSNPVIVTDSDTLTTTVENVVQRAMLDHLPDAIQEANAPDWMSRDEVEARYGITPRQLTYMRNKASIEYTQHGRRILYSRDSLERWIDEGRVKAREGPAAENGSGSP